jgi:SAM-dependent methyltransferase
MTRDAYLPAIMALSGRKMVSIPVERNRSPAAISSYSHLDRLRLGLRGIRTLLGPVTGATSEPLSPSTIGEPTVAPEREDETRSQGPKNYKERTRRQRAYFEKAVKQTMIPRDTPYTAQQVDQLIDFAGLSPESRILEVGCGMGRYTLPLVRRGFQVEGLDLSPKLLDRLRGYAPDRLDIPLHCADILDPPEDLMGRFDAVIGFFTLHHLQDIPGCIAAQVPLMRPGGVMVYLEPNACNPLYYVQMALVPDITWEGDKGTTQMRPGVIGKAMRRAGLDGFSVKKFGFFPPFVRNRLGSDRWERLAERLPGLYPLLPFQMFRAFKPGRSGTLIGEDELS